MPWSRRAVCGRLIRMNLPEPVLAQIRSLAAIPEVETVLLFGSRARGDHAPRSDVDLAVRCPTADALVWDRIVDRLDDARTLLEIDVVRLDRAGADLARRIEKEGVVVYER
jgi:predicted nucleotidyltransferase